MLPSQTDLLIWKRGLPPQNTKVAIASSNSSSSTSRYFCKANSNSNSKPKRIFADQANPSDKNVRAVNQLIARFRAIFPKARLVRLVRGTNPNGETIATIIGIEKTTYTTVPEVPITHAEVESGCWEVLSPWLSNRRRFTPNRSVNTFLQCGNTWLGVWGCKPRGCAPPWWK